VAVVKSSIKPKAIPATATLIAEVPVVVVDVSRCGCLIESTRPLEPGTVGTLQLDVDGHEYVEDVRVARCTAVSGRGSTFRIGVEFLRTRRMPDLSLRHAVAHLMAPGPAQGSGRGTPQPASKDSPGDTIANGPSVPDRTTVTGGGSER
jgi:hypothetical protein